MKSVVRKIPNFITALRIAGTAALLFLAPFTIPFYVLYTACGLTDVLDGAIARATKNTSELGAKLDSIADLLFYAVMLTKVIPALWLRLPMPIWYAAGAVVGIRLASYVTAAVKYHRFAALHTILNKITGLLVFLIPYYLSIPYTVPACWLVVVIAAVASTEELMIHLAGKTAPGKGT